MNHNYYEVDLSIEPERSFINVNLNLRYFVQEDNEKEIVFYIHKDINIEEIICNEMDTFDVSEGIEEWSPFVLESKKIKLVLKKPLLKDDKLNIKFKYNGYINTVTKYGINRITEDWIELGVYTPWYPLTKRMEESLFKVEISIDSEYIILSSGSVEKHNNKWLITQDTPQLDCTIIASNKFNCISKKVNQLNVYYIDDNLKEVASKINSQSLWLLNNYVNRFGNTNNSTLSIVIAPREDGGGYCRDGMIVMSSDESLKDSGIEQEIKTFRFLAHELAHLWWMKAEYSSWEDWLNESFAEYSSLMATRDKYGEKEFLRLIGLYKEKVVNLPAIRGIERSDEKAYEVLYLKGAVLLNELETMVGKETFKDLLSNVHKKEIKVTEKFIDELSSYTDKKIANEFSNLLDL